MMDKILIFKYVWSMTILMLIGTAWPQDCYENMKLRAIPSDHIYHKLKHPSVIGHMGNIYQYQENTIEGIRNLIKIKADGVHMHVSMTSDNQLILFKDKNLQRMTGEDFEVSTLPYSEILKMNLLKSISYYGSKESQNDVLKTFNYGSTRKIPLLRDVLPELKGKGVLVYIELMPSKVASKPLEKYIALKTAELAAKLIKELGMERDVLVVSRDATQLSGVNFNNPNIAFGWEVDSSLYDVTNANNMKLKYGDFPRVYRLPVDCFSKTNVTGFPFTKYLVTSGFLSKAVNASFIDFSVEIYDNATFYGTTGLSSLKDVVKVNYGGETSMGVFNVFSWNDIKVATEKEDRAFINTLKSHGVTRILTNNVNRVKRALDETITPSRGVTTRPYMELLIFTCILIKTVYLLIYV